MHDHEPPLRPRDLLLHYMHAAVWYALLMLVLWHIGIEGIYGHPTPFYALWSPTAPGLWHLPAIGVLLAGYLGLRRLFGILYPFRPDSIPLISPARRRGLLLGAVLFLALFSASVAAIRGGFGALDDAYSRSAYEYINDIGVTPSISALFTRWNELTPYLSMHSKVHPPGPVAFLWLLSFPAGNDPMTLSVFTVLVAALSAIPMFLWLRALYGEKTALYGLLLFLLTPSIVLFSATSADALFMPITLATLWCFERAIAGNGRRLGAWALAAGAGYFLMSILKFSLLSVGAWFAFRALWFLFSSERDPEAAPGRSPLWRVTMIAVLMLSVFLALHAGLGLGTGYDYVENFRIAKGQFDLDQHHLDELTPRLPGWTYRFWNPLCWFYFAGIPISLLFVWGLLKHRAARPLMAALALTLFVLNLAYLARGEGERSALYLFPFVCAGAAPTLRRLVEHAQSWTLLYVTLGALAAQVLITETLFYTYW